MSDIIDEIDALVDEQLGGYSERSSYDYNVNQDRCGHCHREWHGLKITERIESMAAHVAYDEGYRYADDDSEVLCPGSSFIGPWATKRQVQAIRTAQLVGGSPSAPYTLDSLMRMRSELRTRPLGHSLSSVGTIDEYAEFLWYDEGPRIGGVPVFRTGDRIAFIDLNGTRTEGVVTVDQPSELIEIVFDEAAIDRAFLTMEAIAQNMAAAFGEIGQAAIRARQALSGWLPEPEPDTRTPQERALPRPSTTPPMWAVDAGRQRRTRTNSRRRH